MKRSVCRVRSVLTEEVKKKGADSCWRDAAPWRCRVSVRNNFKSCGQDALLKRAESVIYFGRVSANRGRSGSDLNSSWCHQGRNVSRGEIAQDRRQRELNLNTAACVCVCVRVGALIFHCNSLFCRRRAGDMTVHSFIVSEEGKNTQKNGRGENNSCWKVTERRRDGWAEISPSAGKSEVGWKHGVRSSPQEESSSSPAEKCHLEKKKKVKRHYF